MFKKALLTLTTLMTILWSVTCAAAEKANNWLIYWYVCGTNIETTNIAFGPGTDLMSDDPNAIKLVEPDRWPGDVTRCIKEVEKAAFSSNVRIFMQAGGTYVWGHEKFRDLNAKIQTGLKEGNLIGNGNGFYREWRLSDPIKPGTMISPGKLGRYVYDKKHRNWAPLEQIPISGAKNSETDMGSKEGLVSFLRAGQKLEQELYPDGNVRRVLIFKNHGGGIIGVCEDQYTRNIIGLEEMQASFKQVQNDWSNPEEKPFEVVAFDACIMSVYETALALENTANYMVASQESTFNKVGLNYTGLLNDLSKNPSMNGKELGKVICDTCWEDSKNVDKDFGYNTNNVFTFSVIDLSEKKMNSFKTAYANFNEEISKVAQENPDDIISTFTKFKNALNVSDRFSILNVRSDPDMVDLKNFASNLSIAFPKLQESVTSLVKAIDNSVVYNKRGGAFQRGGGISVHYQSLYSYQYLLNNIQSNSINLSGLKEKSVEVDEEKKTTEVELTEDELKVIDSVRYQLLYLLPRNDNPEKMNLVLLGSDSEVEEDRQTGTFKIDLNGKKCFTLNGNLLYVQIVADSTRKGKNGKKIGGNDICVSPILINGKPYKLFFSRNYPSGKTTVIGAVPTRGNNVVTLPSGELESLKKGDVVTPLYGCLNEDNISKAESLGYMTPEKFTVSGKPIVIGDNPKIEMRSLPDGMYAYAFEFVDPLEGINPKIEKTLSKDGAVCKIKNGKIVKVIRADYFDTPADLEN